VFTVKKLDRAQLTAVASQVSNAVVDTIKAVPEAIGNADITVPVDAIKAAAKGDTEALGTAVVSSIQGGAQNLGKLGEKLAPGVNALSNALVKPNRIPGTTIGLYVPDNLQVSYSTEYDSNESLSTNLGRIYFLAQGATSLTKAFADQKDKTLTSMINTAGNDPFVREAILRGLGGLTGSNLTRLGLNAAGYAMNPQLQVLFQGIGFRQFQFDFVFTPYNKKEAKTVNEIIQTFKYHSAPKISRNGAFDQGYYMEIPETFDISFYYGNEENRNVNRIGECVLEGVDVDYAGSGQWSTYNDGSPNQIKMTLRFKETVIIDKNRIEQGY